MGRLPGYVDGVQAVLDMWQNPCGASWEVYLELAREPAGKAVLQLLEFDLCDILRCIYRPAGLPVGTKRRRGRRGKGGLTGPLGAPEYLCEKFIRDPEFSKRPIASGTKLLWSIDGALQKGLFAFMIADVTNEFLYDWMTLVNRTQACSYNLAGSAGGQTGTGPALGGGIWRSVSFESINAYGSCDWIGNTGVACSGNRNEAGGAIAAIPGDFTPPGATYEVRVTKDNIPIWSSAPATGNPNDPQEGIVAPPTKAGSGVYGMQMKVNAGVFEDFIIQSGSFFAADTSSPPAPEPYQRPSVNDVLCFPGAFNSLVG